MTAPRLVVTTNGPGELMGWARPFLRAVYRKAPDARVTVVFVPCPYATGREAELTSSMFPTADVVDPKGYGRFLLRKAVKGMERGGGALQYLGGDLFHATTIARRLGVKPMTYKFTRRSYCQSFVRFFALDERNAAELRRAGAPPDRVKTVGNLVPDAVFGSLSAPPDDRRGDGICILPGSRPMEIKHALPFFIAVARSIRRRKPGIAITFVLSPFNGDDELRAALEARPDPRMGGMGATLAGDGRSVEADGERFMLDRSVDYRALSATRLVLTIPGTKCIESAALARPMLVVVPLNRADLIVMNGVAGYLHLVPLVGRPLKSMIVRAAERRFRFVTQPNIDADREIVPEMRGVLKPDDVAATASLMFDDDAGLATAREALGRIYARDAGASDRMAAEALAVAADEPLEVAL
ncbi:MAG: hypothetical protein ACHQY2_00040 [Candidatus Eremiobacterales bacterium]